jgi:hypothetical protein
MKKLLLISLAVLAAAMIGLGQTSAMEGKAVVYVYSYDVSAVGTIRKTVYLDGQPLADVTPKRYFIAVLEPGKHSLHWKSKKNGGIEYDFKAGTVTYLRAGWREGGIMIKANGLDLVAPENGAFDIKQLRPVDPKNIKDKDRAMLEIPKAGK